MNTFTRGGVLCFGSARALRSGGNADSVRSKPQ